jgi:ribulose-phosphate 3-epimerase
MTVNPGFGGQSLIEGMLPKVQRLRGTLDRLNAQAEIEVDGGIDATTAPSVVEAGAEVLVAGSAVFAAPEGVAAAISALRAASETGAAQREANSLESSKSWPVETTSV